MHLACIFPAFRMRYSKLDTIDLPGLKEALNEHTKRAIAVIGSDISRFIAAPANEPTDDLTAHYRCYIESCAVASIAEEYLGAGERTAGYSMGLYAALCHSGALSFEDGLLLMKRTCELSQELQTRVGGHCGMASLVGLTTAEAAALAASNKLPVEVADVCAERTIIMAGPHDALDVLLAKATEAGCLKARKMPVDLAYHSQQMRAIEPALRECVAKLNFQNPRCPLVSCVSQQLLRTAEDAREEAATNVTRPINWHATFQTLLVQGTDTLVECGLSDSLSKLARTSGETVSIYHPKNLAGLIHPQPPAP